MAKAVVEELASGNLPYYVVALQLQSDKQIHANSPFAHLGEMIETVIASFSAEAPLNAVLVFKEHPHDNGVENWPRVIAEAAARHGV
ncbi:hypothetical protein ABTL50_19330, partial [Acinetobacter baumannii]